MARKTSNSRSRHKKASAKDDLKNTAKKSIARRTTPAVKDDDSSSLSKINHKIAINASDHPVDCECFRLRPGLFLPPGVDPSPEDDEDDKA